MGGLIEGESGGTKDGFDDLFAALTGPCGAEGVFFPALKTTRKIHWGDQAFGASTHRDGGGCGVVFAAGGVENEIDLVALELVFENEQDVALDGVTTSGHAQRRAAVFSAFADQVIVIFSVGGKRGLGNEQRAERRGGANGRR